MVDTKDLYPNPGTLVNNATFAAEALAEYFANKTGKPQTPYASDTVQILMVRKAHIPSDQAPIQSYFSPSPLSTHPRLPS